MRQLANLDCFYLQKEFAALEGSFFENFYDFENGLFRLRLSKQSILADLGGFAFIAPDEAFPQAPAQPSSFAMLVRKHLSGGKLVEAKQLDFDRIFEFSFSSKAQKRSLVFELFGKAGNLLVLDEDRKIIAPFKREEYASRTLKQGQQYVQPPNEKKHPLELTESDVEGEAKIVASLSRKTSLSPFYLERACEAAGVPLETKPSALNAVQKKKILEAIRALFESATPAVSYDNELPSGFSAVGAEGTKFDSLSKAVFEYYSKAPRAVAKNTRSDKLQAQLASQEKLLEGFQARSDEAQQAGKWVFENTHEIEGILAAAREKDQAKLDRLAAKMGLKTKIQKTTLELE